MKLFIDQLRGKTNYLNKKLLLSKQMSIAQIITQKIFYFIVETISFLIFERNRNVLQICFIIFKYLNFEWD
jgi:hypothetical protein